MNNYRHKVQHIDKKDDEIINLNQHCLTKLCLTALLWYINSAANCITK